MYVHTIVNSLESVSIHIPNVILASTYVGLTIQISPYGGIKEAPALIMKL